MDQPTGVTLEFFNSLCERIPLAGLPLFLTFRPDADALWVQLRLMAYEINLIAVDREHQLTKLALSARNFSSPGAARTVRICLLANPGAKSTLFNGLAKLLESVTPAEPHALSRLCSSSESERHSLAHHVQERWISSEVNEALTANDLDLPFAVVEENGFYMLQLTLVQAGATLVRYYLDGWSGLLRRNDLWQRHQLVSRESLNQTILRDIRNAAADTN